MTKPVAGKSSAGKRFRNGLLMKARCTAVIDGQFLSVGSLLVLALLLPYPSPAPANSDCIQAHNPVMSGDGRVMGVNSREQPASVWCYDSQTHQACAGYPLRTGAGAAAIPHTQAVEGRLYFVGRDPFSKGGGSGYVYCWDTVTRSTCGKSPRLGRFTQLQWVKGKLYTLLESGRLDCFDAQQGLARCPAYPTPDLGVADPRQGHADHQGKDLLALDGRLYVLGVYVPPLIRQRDFNLPLDGTYQQYSALNCWDVANGAPCAGWTLQPRLLPGLANLFPRLNPQGQTIGVCAGSVGRRSLATRCFDGAGAESVTLNMGAIAPSRAEFNAEAWSGTRIWFVNHDHGLKCWDWALQDGQGGPCQGTGYQAGETVDAGRPQGVVAGQDCLYTLGDAGRLMAWEPLSGQPGCGGTRPQEIYACPSTQAGAPQVPYVADALDNDEDNDGILSRYERDWSADGQVSDRLPDTDGDGIPDYLDADDDGDGKPSAAEWADPNGDGNPGDAEDNDADGIPDYLDAEDVGGVAVRLRARLQGAAAGTDGLMRDDLRQQGLIPLEQPYGMFGHKGGEVLDPALLRLTGGDAPVDWVLVELWDRFDPRLKAGALAAILQRDGDVADPVSNAPLLRIPADWEDKYYVSLRHRNHLGVMSRQPFFLSAAVPVEVGFTAITTTDEPGGAARAAAGDKVALLWAGDANGNGALGMDNATSGDRAAILAAVQDGAAGLVYHAADVNLDGRVQATGPDNDLERLQAAMAAHPGSVGVQADFLLRHRIPGDVPARKATR